MKTKSMRSATGRASGRKTNCTLGALFALGLFAAAVDAQIIVVNPIETAANELGFSAQLAKSVEQYASQLKQYTTQLAQYKQAIDQYTQILMTVEGLGTNISFTSNKLKPITDYAGYIDQNCPSGASGSIVSSILNAAISSISASQSIRESQHQICAQMTLVQIDQYNKTIEISNTLDTYGGTLQKLNKLANQIDSLGSASGATTQAETYSATVGFAMTHWQAQMAGDKNLLEALEQQQNVLAKVALRGKSTILGNVVQAATLEAWFAANPYTQK